MGLRKIAEMINEREKRAADRRLNRQIGMLVALFCVVGIIYGVGIFFALILGWHP